jgi:hypothetical protein
VAGLARLSGAVGIAAIATFFTSASSRAQTAAAPPAFNGSSSALGVRMTVTIPGAPVTDTPIDGGGPTAQVAVDSIGSSTGYAAFPDPGGLAISAPGLIAGLVTSPHGLPSPPNYPFYVSSDVNGPAEVSQGSGPYQLSASSQSGLSKAQATTGFQTGLAGNAALLTSTASLSPSDRGGVVAKATADLQGLTVGPMAVGEVKSVATETMDSSGTVTPSTTLEIAGLRVGGVPVELAPQGFVAGGATYPVPINDTLNSLLKSSGITMQFVAAQTFPDRVVAPALQITFPFAMPFAVPNVGKFSGTVTAIFGSAMAQMSGAAAEQGASVGQSGTGGTGTEASASLGGSGSTAAGGSQPAAVPALAGAGSPSGSASTPALASPSSVRPTGTQRGSRLAAAGQVDVRSLYLVVVVGVIVALAAGQLIRRLGVRA